MKLDSHPPAATTEDVVINICDPIEIINVMLDLRAQLAELEQQIKTLQPAFFAACAALKLEKITTDRALISRRLTPGQWDYSDEIVEQEDLLKQLKSQFQKAHEPIGGREVYWIVKFLLATV